MKLVELIPALQTDPTVLATAREFAERMGKTVTQSADTPGTPTTTLCHSFFRVHDALMLRNKHW